MSTSLKEALEKIGLKSSDKGRDKHVVRKHHGGHIHSTGSGQDGRKDEHGRSHVNRDGQYRNQEFRQSKGGGLRQRDDQHQQVTPSQNQSERSARGQSADKNLHSDQSGAAPRNRFSPQNHQTSSTANLNSQQRPTGQRPQRQQNFCEACKKILPDVELYHHDNKNLSGEWLCCLCADKYKIPDNCRQTNQSDFSKKRIFRREYGATKRFFG